MPELPDIVAYIEALERLIQGRAIERIHLKSPFFLRSVEPGLNEAEGRNILGFLRLGKRVVWALEDDLFLVFHLMIAGRFHWKKASQIPRKKTDLIAFQFLNGTLMVTEAGSKKRASLNVVRGKENLGQHNPGGLEVMECSQSDYRDALKRENHTLKRALSDPRLFSGIGNAYSDEILHAAGLSPVKWTTRLSEEEIDRLYESTVSVLEIWIERLRDENREEFPEKVTAFRKEMAVHGRFGKPCPRCGTSVQRIVYAENETNYCPRCQTGGKVLADRGLSRLLKGDWPRTIEELESRPGFSRGEP